MIYFNTNNKYEKRITIEDAIWVTRYTNEILQYRCNTVQQCRYNTKSNTDQEKRLNGNKPFRMPLVV